MVPQPREQGQSGGDAGEEAPPAWLLAKLRARLCRQGVRTPILQLSAMQEGDYTFQLTVTDSAGQQDTAQVTVIVQPGELLIYSFLFG